MTSRRNFIGAAALAFPFINKGRFQLFATSQTQYSARAIDLMKRATVFDMLSPMTLNFPLQDKWNNNPELFTPEIKRYLDSGIHVFHIAVGIGGPDGYNQGLRFISQWNSLIAGNDTVMMRIDSAADFERVRGSGKIGILLGIQNSD